MTEIASALFGFGLDGDDLGSLQMALRAVLVYGITIVMIRLGKRHFMSHDSGLDLIVGISIGAIVSRAIVGSSPFLPALAAAAALVAAHWLLSLASARWRGVESLLKGEARVLIEEGVVRRDRLRNAHISDDDLWEELRDHGVRSLGEVERATLERSGRISVIKARPA